EHLLRHRVETRKPPEDVGDNVQGSLSENVDVVLDDFALTSCRHDLRPLFPGVIEMTSETCEEARCIDQLAGHPELRIANRPSVSFALTYLVGEVDSQR